jgi:sarcosine oxidase subunit gamma
VANTPDRVAPLTQLAAATASETGGRILIQTRKNLTMLDIRGGRNPAFFADAKAALGIALPTSPNTSFTGPAGVALWLGPDQWLLVGDTATAWSEEVQIVGGTLTDVSHGRVAVRIAGHTARELLAQGCMLDLHPCVFTPLMCAQTIIAKIPTIIHRPGIEHLFDLYVPRSYARSFWEWLMIAVQEYGYRLLPAA